MWYFALTENLTITMIVIQYKFILYLSDADYLFSIIVTLGRLAFLHLNVH